MTSLARVAAELRDRTRCTECRELVERTIGGMCDECREFDDYQGADCGA